MWAGRHIKAGVNPPSSFQDIRPVKRELGTRSLRILANKFRESLSGAIAVETALIAPFVLLATIVAGSLAITVYNHQKLLSAGYSGVSFLQDHMASGDYAKLRGLDTDEEGQSPDSDLIRRTKLVIKDASGLPIKLEDILVEVYCGCPQGGSGNGDDNESFDVTTLSASNPFYSKRPLSEAESGSGSDAVCSVPCGDGEKSRIIAEIDLSITRKNLMGSSETSSERLITRLR